MAENNKHHSDLTPGTVVGDYKIIKILRSDKSGGTCLAADTQLDKNVVIKFIPKNLSIKQVMPAARLSHPNIISILESGEFINRPYIVSDYIKGKRLTEFIEEGSVSEEFVIDIAIQISDSLAYAHSENVIHGSIATSNIIIDFDGRPKLNDFAFYSGKKKKEDDLRDLGALLYEMLTGKSLGDTCDDSALKTSLAGSSEKLVDIIVKLISNSKDSAFESAEELYNVLVRLPQSKNLSSQKPVDWWNRIVVPIAFIILVVVAIYWLIYVK